MGNNTTSRPAERTALTNSIDLFNLKSVQSVPVCCQSVSRAVRLSSTKQKEAPPVISRIKSNQTVQRILSKLRQMKVIQDVELQA